MDNRGLSIKFEGLLENNIDNIYDEIFMRYINENNSEVYVKGELCHKKSMFHHSSEDGISTVVEFLTNEVSIIDKLEFEKAKRQSKIKDFFDNDIVHER